MEDVASTDALHKKAQKFLVWVAEVSTLEEFVEECVEEAAEDGDMDEERVVIDAHIRYEAAETLEYIIRQARGICREQGVEVR